MDIFQSIIMGIVEGFTEFLPVSSTGHMIVTAHFLGIKQDSVTKAYEVIIQFAAILAVVLHYKEKFTIKKIDFLSKLFLAFLPLAIIGFLFSKQIKGLFDLYIVAIMFIVGGVAFLLAEKFYKEETYFIDDVEKLSYKQAFFIGLAQVLGLIPGTSRSGSTIIAGMFLGLTRKASAEFSFLLAVPVMSAATAYDVWKHYHEFNVDNLIVLGVGFVVSFVVAYATIRLFLGFLRRFTFVSFGIYRILFGIFLLSIYSKIGA